MSYKAFRAKYPQGSLVTQLLQIDHGQYIVQCLILDSDRTIASGLAGDRILETAEDRAIERALRLLAVEDNSEVKTYFTNSVPEMTVLVENDAITKEYRESLDKYQEEALHKFNYKTVDEPENRSTVDMVNRMEQASIFSKNITKCEKELAPLQGKKSVLSKEKAAEIATDILNSAKKQIKEDKLTENVFSAEIFNSTYNTENIIPEETEQSPTESSETPLACESFDFSSVIAKTNIELKRLNWSTQQGREYLMSKYGKRSRQLLSDGELVEFLAYLEAQPTEMEI